MITRVLLTICCGIFFSTIMAFSSGAFSSNEIPEQQKDQALYQRLPADVRASGMIKGVHDGAIPPFVMIRDRTHIEGVSADLIKALGELLGVTITPHGLNSFPALLSGIKSGRFHMSITPIADRPARYKHYDFIDFISDRTAFAVQPGNPGQVDGLQNICGKKIAVQSGVLPEERLKKRSEECIKENKKAINIQSYPSLSTGFLSVRSGRADALMSSQIFLKSLVKITGVYLEVFPINEPDPANQNTMGIMLPKDCELKPIIQDAMQQLFDNGTYRLIMQKWGIADHMLPAPVSNIYENRQ
ncbi:MAG: transporter substrate-binding domain-containing protein [Enterobacteriaceae bacterium]